MGADQGEGYTFDFNPAGTQERVAIFIVPYTPTKSIPGPSLLFGFGRLCVRVQYSFSTITFSERLFL